PPYSGYREVESREAEPRRSAAAKPPVTVHTIPPRDISAPQAVTEETVQLSRGMTEDQVKSLLGQPMIQVVLGDARSYVYDRFVVEFEKGRVKNVVFK
ncbi:MAG TPA: outer membrane protein assembly factor BamE, partial [Acidobacteriota bacterium]|nr:outer membrane protein assembly factor BamE [Acidobacteriota bacterium]